MAALNWILTHPTKKAAHYKTYFNQSALNDEVKLVQQQREIEIQNLKHVLNVCHAAENDKWHLNECGATSLDDLLQIPLEVEKFKQKLQVEHIQSSHHMLSNNLYVCATYIRHHIGKDILNILSICRVNIERTSKCRFIWLPQTKTIQIS